MRSLPLPLATGRKFDTFIALSHYALIANQPRSRGRVGENPGNEVDR